MFPAHAINKIMSLFRSLDFYFFKVNTDSDSYFIDKLTYQVFNVFCLNSKHLHGLLSKC